jgi:Fe-S cluster assembly protein SufD
MNSVAEKETIYASGFRQSLEASNQPGWLKDLRLAAFEYFTGNGFPAPQNEEWKYTNTAKIAATEWLLAPGKTDSKTADISTFVFEESRETLAVFINGRFNRELSNLSALEGARILEFSEAVDDDNYSAVLRSKLASSIEFDKNGFTALNTAFVENGVMLVIPKNVRVSAPIQFLFLTDDGIIAFPRILVLAEAFSEATIVETYVRAEESTYLTCAVTEIFLADEAKIKHTKVQRESHSGFHVGAAGAEIYRGSVYDSTSITLGAKLSRHDIAVKFRTSNGEAFVDGLYMVGGEQHADTHSVIDHQLPNCTSHQNYKGIVDGKARAVFNGKVFVRENASGTDAQQSNKNLLLSNDARVDTKPQLEIFNDDVKCAHGATVGQLEEEELFYLLSRGLNESLARNLLTYGFAEEIVSKIEIESIKKQLDEAVLTRLNAKLDA